MRTKSTLLALLLSVAALNAHGWSLWEISGAKMDIDGKDIRVASVNTIGDDHVFRSNDQELENGVCVVAMLNSAGPEILPRTTELIRTYLRTRGLNVTSDVSGCSIAINFIVPKLNIDSATEGSNEAAANKPGFGSQAAVNAERVAGAAAVANISGALAGGLAFAGSGTAHYEGDLLTLSSESIVNPSNASADKSKMMEGKVRDKHVITARVAQKKSDPNTTTADLLTLMVKVWADKYFVKE